MTEERKTLVPSDLIDIVGVTLFMYKLKGSRSKLVMYVPKFTILGHCALFETIPKPIEDTITGNLISIDKTSV